MGLVFDIGVEAQPRGGVWDGSFYSRKLHTTWRSPTNLGVEPLCGTRTRTSWHGGGRMGYHS